MLELADRHLNSYYKISKDIEDIRSLSSLVAMKIIMSGTTNALGEINVRLDIAERIMIFET